MLRLAFDFIITWRETRTRPNAYEWTTKSFKEVYNSLDKEKFLIKINQAIKKYGNMISVYGGVPFCIRTDEKIHLLSYLKGLHPDERIETWDMVYD